MGPAAAVLVCALDLLGASARNLPPIELVPERPPDVSAEANGFVRAGTPIIYLLTSSSAFRNAECASRRSLMTLASVVVHEEFHVRHGSDEKGAYEAQLGALLRLGALPDSPAYRSVLRAMRVVLKKKEQERTARLAAVVRGQTMASVGPERP